MINKKGQTTLQGAPQLVVIVGLVFLIMATIAFIGSKYGTAIGSDVAGTTINESVTLTTVGTYVNNASLCNFDDFAVTAVYNTTHSLVASTNYTTTSAGLIANKTGPYGAQPWKVSYTYNYGGTACEVTTDLQTEIANNTSIAGIILTISLVGIVLTVLIGIFLVTRVRGRA